MIAISLISLVGCATGFILENLNHNFNLTAQHQTLRPAAVPHSSKCNKIRVFDTVARNVYVHNQNGRDCLEASGRHGDDAFVMSLCHAPDSSKWIEGEQVITNGVCAASAHNYAPVYFHYFDGSMEYKLAGILLSCSKDGLKVFYQSCHETPGIAHIKPEFLRNMHVLTWL